MIDTEKLARLRHAHDGLHAQYMQTAQRAQQAAAEIGPLLHAVAADPSKPRTAALLALPIPDLAETPRDELQAAGFELRTVRKLHEAHTRAQTLRSEAEALAAELQQSRALLTRLNNYAKRFDE
ncbi:MAG: hypothetical protein OJF60_002193 [Burkholderiaceae bacterium]|jgi:hypothetical protein|nr:MAG: hypothetical protein OJF60_002193 [Burkholderiaceae bacterium]